MPSYNLTPNQEAVIVTWLFEPNGYLDFSIRLSDGQTAREALIADPGLDVTEWIRDNPQLRLQDSTECAMVWWIWKNDQVNIPVAQRPPEAAQWAAILHQWDQSIVTAFGKVGQVQRDDSNAVLIYDANGQPDGEMRAGTQLVVQRQIFSDALRVLE